MTITPPSLVDQTEYWNGPTGEKWAALQERIDAVFAPLTQALLAHLQIQPGERCIDIGCGAGDLALHLARASGPGGHVTGLDVSRPMLAQARRRAEALVGPKSPIDWIETDAASATLPRVDRLASRFGVMFFSNPVAAFANLRRALDPGGRLTMMCWRKPAENGWASVPARAIASVIGEPAPTEPGTPGPFAFADRERVLGILGEAGFAETRAVPVEAELLIGRGPTDAAALEDAVAYSLQIGPAARLLTDIAEGDPLREQAKALVQNALEASVRNGEVKLSAACWVYEASR